MADSEFALTTTEAADFSPDDAAEEVRFSGVVCVGNCRCCLTPFGGERRNQWRKSLSAAFAVIFRSRKKKKALDYIYSDS